MRAARMPTTPSCQVGSKNAALVFARQIFQQGKGLIEHVRLDLLALAVQPVELLRAVRGARLVVGEQALDAEAHVGEAAGGVEPRAGDEAEVEARRLGRVAPRRAQQRRDAGWPRPARRRFRPCDTRLRLLASSGTTSAMVPRATRSVRDAQIYVPV